MSTDKYIEAISTACNYIRSQLNNVIPKVAIILGSGLGPLADAIKEPVVMPYETIPNFPVSTVPGHDGKLIYGRLGDNYVIVMKGRFHYYEGYDITTVTFPVRVFAKLGIKTLFVTNAAGGIGNEQEPGSIMIIKDQINLFAPSPLRGPNLDEFGPRFKDMTEIYSPKLIQIARDAAKRLNIEVSEGVYAFNQGPHFESPADVQVLKMLGANAVGMSTVPETIVARHSGMESVGLSLITNKAAGLSSKQLDHEEVLETGQIASEKFSLLTKEIIKEIYNNDSQLQ